MDIPRGLRQRPRYRGLPVPFTTFINTNGVPDFRVVDEYARLLCIERRLCALCGQTMRSSHLVVFIGGERCCEHGRFLDPAMHEDCALYAAATCPYLTGNHEHRPGISPNAQGVYDLVTTERPLRMGLYYTRGYSPMSMGVNGIYIQAWQAVKIDWDTIPPGRPRDGALPADHGTAAPVADDFMPRTTAPVSDQPTPPASQ